MENNQQQNIKNLKIAVIGNVDSGKSTLVGFLSKGLLDDGRGLARNKILNHSHEQENGRTTSIAKEIIGYDSNLNQVLPKHFQMCKNKYWKEVVKDSVKIVDLIDLCGHEKYLKTTMFGLTSVLPDYAMICIGANMGISKMVKEHLGIIISMNIPFFIVVTKIDICPQNILQETLEKIKKILKLQVVGKRIMYQINEKTTDQDILNCQIQLNYQKLTPVFQISSLNGTGLKQFHTFLANLNNRIQTNPQYIDQNGAFHLDIIEKFQVSGTGTVISGIVISGTAKPGQIICIGPDNQNSYQQYVIKSIHVSRFPKSEANKGDLACLAIKSLKSGEKINKKDFRKGIVAIDQSIEPLLVEEFEAEVSILHHSSTIKPGYQSQLHSSVIRQQVAVVNIKDKEEIVNGSYGFMRFKFMYNPEYIKVGYPLLFREGKTKIMGKVTKIYKIPTQNIQGNIFPQQIQNKTKNTSIQLKNGKSKVIEEIKNNQLLHQKQQQIEKNQLQIVRTEQQKILDQNFTEFT